MSTNTRMKAILGLLLILASIIVGIWLGVFVMFIGGIIQFIQALQSNPINSYGLAFGLARFLFSSLIGWLSFILLFTPGMLLLDSK